MIFKAISCRKKSLNAEICQYFLLTTHRGRHIFVLESQIEPACIPAATGRLDLLQTVYMNK